MSVGKIHSDAQASSEESGANGDATEVLGGQRAVTRREGASALTHLASQRLAGEVTFV